MNDILLLSITENMIMNCDGNTKRSAVGSKHDPWIRETCTGTFFMEHALTRAPNGHVGLHDEPGMVRVTLMNDISTRVRIEACQSTCDVRLLREFCYSDEDPRNPGLHPDIKASLELICTEAVSMDRWYRERRQHEQDDNPMNY